MANTPSFAATPVAAVATVSVANANRDGTGTIENVLTAGASGTRIDDIELVALGTTTAGVLRLFLYTGALIKLWREIEVQAKTPSASAQVWSEALRDLGLVLPNGWALRASTERAESFNVIVSRAGNL